MYNQFQSSFGQPVQSQYRGFQRQFQPTGRVQSSYGSGFGANPQAQSYHAANYVGNQQGHDQNLRADSVNPSSYATGRSQGFGAAGGFRQSGQSAGGFQQSGQSAGGFQQSGQSAGGFQQQTNPASYHAANYVGNQQGHDQYLRADSVNPSSYASGRGQSQSQSQSWNFRSV